MVNILRRIPRSKLTQIILVLCLLQLVIYLGKNVFDDDSYKSLNLILLNKTSIESQFIETYFSSASEGSWQYVSDIVDIRNKFLAFSAFLDNRLEEQFVKIIAVTKTKKKFRRTVWCKFWYQKVKRGSTKYYTTMVAGKFQLISEHWGLPYSAYYVQCPVYNDSYIPNSVSLLSDPAEIPKNLFKVIVNLEKSAKWNLFDLPSIFKNMAICVKPLHYDYNEVMEIIQFIEMHQIMGVNQFFLYNHTIGPQVNCLLKNYIKEGIVTILPWNLPLVTQEEIRTEGIFAALNDCLYRTMHVYSHTMFIDFDEYILPRKDSTFKEFFESLDAHNGLKNTAAFLFQNGFFYRQWPDDSSVNNFNDPLAANLLLLKKTRRRKALHPHRTRSKYIARPELVNMVGNHFIWQYANRKFKPMNVSPNDGILHHYRVCEFGGADCVTQESVIDRTAYNYKDQLVRAVRRRLEKHRTECQLNDFVYSS